MAEDDLLAAAAEAADGRLPGTVPGLPPAERAVLDELRVLAAIAVPRRWGPLRVLEPIGEGGNGRVYRAWDETLQRPVALKLTKHVHDVPDEEALAEARRLALVRHPGVVTVHGAAHHAGRTGLWMELLAGGTLEERVRLQGPLSAAEAARASRDLCGALAAVHRAGLVHGDVSARNVFLDRHGRVVLMDFGLGRSASRPGPASRGTPPYVAPELLCGSRPSVASDVYAAAALLWLAVAGEHAPSGTLPGPVRGVLRDALAPDPAQRPTDMDAFGARLTAAFTRSGGRARRFWAVASAAVVLAVSTGLPALAPGGAERAAVPPELVTAPPAQLAAEAPLTLLPGRDPFVLAGGPRSSSAYVVEAAADRPGHVRVSASRPLVVYVLADDGSAAVVLPMRVAMTDAVGPGWAADAWFTPRRRARHVLVVATEPVTGIEGRTGPVDRAILAAARPLASTPEAVTGPWVRHLR